MKWSRIYPKKRSVLQVHPRGNRGNPLTGVFACRSLVRPNLIALSLCQVLSVKNNVVEIDKIDAFANTPILDLKPYIPGYYSAEASVPDWLMNREKTIDKNAGDRNWAIFLLDRHWSLADQGSAKILDISIPMSFRGGFRKPLCIKISAHLFLKNCST